MPTRASRALPNTEDARVLAKRRLPRLIYDFIDGGAGRERGIARNLEDLGNILLQPRSLAEVKRISLATSLLGKTWDVPFGIAPMGMCNLAWPEADLHFARLSRNTNLPLGVSTASSTSLEELFRLSDARAWFQLYVTGTIAEAVALTDRAAQAGYETLMLTVDVPRISKRPRDVRNGFSTPFRMGARSFFDFASHPGWSLTTLAKGVPGMANYSGTQSKAYDRQAPRTGADWGFLQSLRDRWRGKLVIKGVLSAEDARRMKQVGVDAVYVSNHGGRQLESAPSAIAALPGIRQAVGPDMALIFDSGIRSGDDIVKAKALGADFAMVGRPFLYAAAAVGPEGPERLFACLTDEITTALAQVGRASFESVNGECLFRGSNPPGSSRQQGED